MTVDDVPEYVFSYYTKWIDSIAKYARSCHGFQISGSDITIRHLVECYAHRGGKANLGVKKTPAHCASMSKARLEVKKPHSAMHPAKEDEKIL